MQSCCRILGPGSALWPALAKGPQLGRFSPAVAVVVVAFVVAAVIVVVVLGVVVAVVVVGEVVAETRGRIGKGRTAVAGVLEGKMPAHWFGARAQAVSAASAPASAVVAVATATATAVVVVASVAGVAAVWLVAVEGPRRG